jgi:hypothetical protein
VTKEPQHNALHSKLTRKGRPVANKLVGYAANSAANPPYIQSALRGLEDIHTFLLGDHGIPVEVGGTLLELGKVPDAV